ncbi:hypothetical protein OS493_019302, partial [Desmophyllum pertusum]
RTSSETTNTTPTRVTTPASTSNDINMAASSARSTTPGDLTVSLVIFSGRRDPEWQVLMSYPNYKEIQRLLDIARTAGFTYRPIDMPARLGYKGFLVHNTAMKDTQAEFIGGPNTVQLQKLLLKTMPASMLSENFRKDILETIDTGAATAVVQGGT